MTKVDLGPSYTAENYEADNLCHSPIACAVADAWVTIRGFAGFPTAKHEGDNGPHSSEGHASYVVNRMVDLRDALDALESATRESPLRKVR